MNNILPNICFTCVKGLRHEHDNGLYHRFMLFCPSSKKLSANDIMNAPDSIVSKTGLILFIRMVHKHTRRHYTLDDASTRLCSQMFDQYNEWNDVFNQFDFFPGYKLVKIFLNETETSFFKNSG